MTASSAFSPRIQSPYPPGIPLPPVQASSRSFPAGHSCTASAAFSGSLRWRQGIWAQSSRCLSSYTLSPGCTRPVSAPAWTAALSWWLVSTSGVQSSAGRSVCVLNGRGGTRTREGGPWARARLVSKAVSPPGSGARPGLGCSAVHCLFSLCVRWGFQTGAAQSHRFVLCPPLPRSSPHPY